MKNTDYLIEVEKDLEKALEGGKEAFEELSEYFEKKCYGNIKYITKEYYFPYYEQESRLPLYIENLKNRLNTEGDYLDGNDSCVENAEWAENFFSDICCDISDKISELKKDLEIFEELAGLAESLKWSAKDIRDLSDELQEAQEEAEKEEA